MLDVYSMEFNRALQQAGDELGLANDYQPCVRPLLTMPVQQWPRCCGGGCEPCAQQLIAVARRICILLGIEVTQLGTQQPATGDD